MNKLICMLLVFVTPSLFAQQAEEPTSATNGVSKIILDVASDTKVDIVNPVEGKVTRVFTAYTDFSSGTINPNNYGLNLLGGNSVEFGLVYEQNFARAVDMTVGFRGYILTTVDVLSTPSNVSGMGEKGIYIRDPGIDIFIGYKYFRVEIDSQFRFKPSFFYSFDFKKAGRLSLYTGLEISMLPLSNTLAGGGVSYQYLRLFDIRISYGLMLSKTLRFSTELRFRFNGKGGDDITPDSTRAFINSFNIRWNNTLSYYKDGFYIYGQLRYQAERIAHDLLEPAHRLSLHTGLGFTFNFPQNK